MNANLGRTYYSKFIKTSEGKRLSKFIRDGRDPLDRGFVAVHDLDNPTKPSNSRNTAKYTTVTDNKNRNNLPLTESPEKLEENRLQNRTNRFTQ